MMMTFIGSIPTWIVLLLYFDNICGAPDIIFSNVQDIRKFEYGTSSYSNVQGGLEESRYLAYDYDEQLLFYTTMKQELYSSQKSDKTVIEKMSLDKDNDETVSTIVDATSQNGFNGLAIDWVTKKIYFTDLETNRIEVCNYDGSLRRVIVSKGLDQPRDIAVLPQEGYLFVTDWGDISKVERYDMDGSNPLELVNTFIKWPFSIAVDIKMHYVYWGDITMNKIEYMTTDGKNRKVIELNDFQNPYYISVYDNMIFWSNAKSSIFYVEMNGGSHSNITHIDQLAGSSILPYGLTIFSKDMQPDVTTTCSNNNGGCSHLCLITSTGHSCACPTGVTLKQDNKTCRDGMKQFLLIARKVDIRIMSLDADKNVDIILPIREIESASGIDYDILTNKVYWTDRRNQSINSAYLDGSGFQTVISYDIKAPDHIAIDSVARNLYWTDPGLKRIEVSRMDGSSRKIIVSENLGQPRGIAVDHADGRIYWSDWGNSSKIESADLDGSNRKVLVDKLIEWPNGITLDLQHRILYWVDAKYKAVKSYNIILKEVRNVFSDDSHPYDITALGDYIYWTDWLRKVMRMNPFNGEVEMILDGPGISDVMSIKAVNTEPQYGANSPCYYKRSNCSHLCFHKPEMDKDQWVCACPTNMELGKDMKTCNVPSGFLLYAQKNVIMKASVDTFNNAHQLPFPEFDWIYFIATHHKTGHIIWVGLYQDKYTINSAFFNGSGYQVIVKEGLSLVQGLSVDWMAGNVYWVLTKQSRIEVSRLDGKYRKVLVYAEDMVSPRFLAVNPHTSKMYWFQEGEALSRNQGRYTLVEANLDGTNRQVIVKNQAPRCLTIDYDTHLVYWVYSADRASKDIIHSYNPITKTTNTLNHLPNQSTGLLVYDKSLFFANSHTASIHKIGLNATGPSKEIIHNVEWVFDMTTFHGDLQKGQDNCSFKNGGCEHLCFASTPTAYSCSCSTQYTLNPDNRTCSEPTDFLLVSTESSLVRLVFNSSIPEAVLPVSSEQPSTVIDFDVLRGFLYSLIPDKNTVTRCLQDGSKCEVILLTKSKKNANVKSRPYDFSIDFYGNAMYWTDQIQNEINFLHLKTFENGTIFHEEDLLPRKIVVYSEIARLFWSALSAAQTRIISTSMAGTDLKTLITLGKNSEVQDLTLDIVEKRIYWLDSGLESISSMTLEGKDVKKLSLIKLENPISLGIFSDYIYWADTETKFIHKAYKNNASNPTAFFGKYSNMGAMIVVNNTRSKKAHPCIRNNGGCSHLCYLDYEESLSPGEMKHKARCACPLKYTLDKNETKCLPIKQCNDDEIFCHRESVCIKKSLQCDYKCDCQSGCEDESVEHCPYPRDCASSDLLQCGIGCIHKSKNCDGVVDCPSSEDEKNCNSCNADEFSCDKICHKRKFLCNGAPDCLDKSDEKNCPFNGTTKTTVIVHPESSPKQSGIVVAGIISGVIICAVVLTFGILLWFKLRNSKKNAARQKENITFLTLGQLNHKTESVASDEQAKSSVTYISAVSEPSYYDRNNVTGASSSAASGCSHLPFNPPPSHVTALSTITETNGPYGYATCEQCRNTIEEIPMSEIGGGDAPPPTLASTLDDVDLYIPLQQPSLGWHQKAACHNCQTSHNRQRQNRHSNSRPDQSYRNGVLRGYSSDNVSELEPLNRQYLYQNHDNDIHSPHYDGDSLYMTPGKQQRQPFFDPPPTPCTYLSDDERPPSPAETEQSIAFSVIRGGVESHPHYAPPPSPTSQL